METRETILTTTEIEKAIETVGDIRVVQVLYDNREDIERHMESVRFRDEIDNAFRNLEAN